MAFAEFGHFVHMCGVAHYRDDRARVKDAYVDATRARLTNPDALRLLSRAEFASALVRLALAGTPVSDPARLVELEALFHKKVVPFAEEREADVVFAAFESPAVTSVVENARVHLKRVFEHYATKPHAGLGDFGGAGGGDAAGGGGSRASKDSGRGGGGSGRASMESKSGKEPKGGGGDSKESGHLPLDGFRQALLDSHLLDLVLTEDHAMERIDKVTLHSFLTSQGDPPVHLELEELVFAEFLHAACRVAVELLDGDDVAQKMMLGLDALLEHSLNV